MNVLFVCLGNICRSPMARVILEKLYADSGVAGTIDSCAVTDWNVGRPADERARIVCRENGLDLGGHRARQIEKSDFYNFDLIVVMDRGNEQAIKKLRPEDARAKVVKVAEFEKNSSRSLSDLEDPYHGDMNTFRSTFRRLHQLLSRFVEDLSKK
ncbi:MAG TPA: low molecular weight protein-tyrosine-phosphatase [Candidatus Melainabacteria bacterium]|nr:low molecular weight protein-tyrosine-phosphatase [Candidatus Melainabacteria bacterium]